MIAEKKNDKHGGKKTQPDGKLQLRAKDSDEPT